VSPPAPGLPPEVESLLEDWEQFALKASDRQSQACDHFEQRDSFFGISSTVLAAVVGSTLFVTLQNTTTTAIRLLFGTIGVAGAVLSGIQTTAKYGNRAERHRQAARQYGAAVRTIAELRALPPAADQIQARLDGVRKTLDDAGAMAANVPSKIWNGPPTQQRRPTAPPT